MRAWTEEQQNAISSRGGTLLVSAAAGSGKTAVLVERVIQRILDPINPVSADRLLIVTFSNAAAREMKHRISTKISELISESPDNHTLLRQQMLLDKAQISTIHSFCLELIRQNYNRLDISPDFRLSDEKELDIMRLDTVSEVIEESYQNIDDEVFLNLVELLSSGRDDKRLAETILKLYDFIRSHPFYEDWLDNKLGIYRDNDDVCESIWGKTILAHAHSSLDYVKSTLEKSLEIIDTNGMDAYIDAFKSDLNFATRLIDTLSKNDWDGMKSQLESISFERLKSLRGFEDVALQELIKARREKVKDIIKELRDDQFCATKAQFKEDIDDLVPKIEKLFQITKTFGRKLDEQKRLKKVLDFSDLEHLSLQLLIEKHEGKYIKTAFAKEIAEGFDEVFVDEYQDTNEAQDMLFHAVSRDDDNLFMVGDVKQSIYRFRQAMPEIFIEKKKRFSHYDGVHYPAKIMLGRNFRSRDSVTSGINFLFSMIMSEEIGELDYNHEEALIPSAEYPEYHKAGWDVHLLDASNISSEDEPIQIEAKYIANEIKKLFAENYQVTDNGVLRGVKLSDICILLRSVKNKAEIYQRCLTESGIEASSDAQKGYLLCREISAIMSLLKAIDNPLKDIDIVAAMMSPMFMFTADEISKIRLVSMRVPFYVALRQHAETDAKSQNFIDILAKLRRYSATMSAAEIIRKVYSLTEFEAIAGAMSAGESRQSNLRLLIEYASYYDKAGYKGLHSFVSFVDKIIDEGGDLSAPASSLQGDESVKIMSIHRSKGLEFPIVFIADTSKQFNVMDLRQNTLLHSQMGFACVRRDEKLMRQFTTIPMEAMKLELERSMLSEELRILYVALTRAREKIIVTSIQKNPTSKLKSLSSFREGGKISPRLVRDARSYADWILMSLMQHRDSVPIRDAFDVEAGDRELIDDTSRFNIIIPELSADGEVIEEKTEREFTAPIDNELLEKLKLMEKFTYKNEIATKIPTKLAVSEIAKASGESYRFRKRPDFITKVGLTPAEKGNAIHKFMQFCDYINARDDIKSELTRLNSMGFLSNEEKDCINEKKLQGFFTSSLAWRIFSSSKVLREFKFLSEIGDDILSKYSDMDLKGNKTAVQGVADCIFIENNQAIIVDYKTDYCNNINELVDKYRIQLLLYKEILAETLEMSVSQAIIYSFHLGDFITVEG